MTEHPTYEQLAALADKLHAEVQATPKYQQWQAACTLRDAAKPSRPHLVHSAEPAILPHAKARNDVATSTKEKDDILSSWESLHLANGNGVLHLDTVASKLAEVGINVPGKKASATLGALAKNDPLERFYKPDEKKPLWSLRQQYYAKKNGLRDMGAAD